MVMIKKKFIAPLTVIAAVLVSPIVMSSIDKKAYSKSYCLTMVALDKEGEDSSQSSKSAQQYIRQSGDNFFERLPAIYGSAGATFVKIIKGFEFVDGRCYDPFPKPRYGV